ncbi:cobyrinate a,c-diamide synthase [Mycobacterium manitobense]|uniref:Hydrogenobyrinate a,c-diamide synthase n=1 Tax=[Mycobacterium] manitobense TaxID=190147 RepID=A0A9X3BXX8_9MYCO|nr:cobyrinate a,c-diamide synthase [[Mycobacterium] manitobense]
MSVPALVIAAPASGSGKTTVATGLMGALRLAGRSVAPFKVGPDFIDPGYHALAADRPGRNLDPVLVGESLIGPLYRHGSDGADLAVVEGVMGLFDGRISDEPITGPARGSTAQVAALLGAPVVLVIDARGQSHSVAALLHGFVGFDPAVRIAGVILNRVGSPRHEQVLRQACEYVGLPVFGAIPRTEALAVPSRHLGLVTAGEHGAQAREAVEAMTEVVGRHLDLAGITAVATSRVDDPPWNPATAEPVGNGVTVAVAAGNAFNFRYTEHAEMLRAAGAEVVDFDPLTDPLPSRTAALVLPGGFPEQHAAELSANDILRQQIRTLAAAGAPVHAECGGLTYLVDELDGHPMCGVLSGSAEFTPRLTLGYRSALATGESVMYQVGDTVTGHEFHRTATKFTGDYGPAWRFSGDRACAPQDGALDRNVHASYLHTHPASVPAAVTRFVAAAARL